MDYAEKLHEGIQLLSIIENKKTYLFLKAMEFANANDKQQLSHLFSIQLADNAEKIEAAKKIFVESGASEATKKAIANYTLKAFETLEKLNISENKKQLLKERTLNREAEVAMKHY